MKILVLGGGGQVGSHLIPTLMEEGAEVFATYMIRKPQLPVGRSSRLDKTSNSDVRRLIESVRPQTVIDLAAFNDVERCETDRKHAREVNSLGTQYVAKACSALGAKMVYVSTDYVFDGKAGNYKETDTPNPVNYYGQVKRDGEKAVIENCKDFVIVRPSVIFTWRCHNEPSDTSSGKAENFANWVYRKLVTGDRIRGVTDQVSSPTLAQDLARNLCRLVMKDSRGLFHVAGDSQLSRYDFAVKIANVFNLNASLIKPILSEELRQVAPRPHDTSLNVSKIERELGAKPLNIDDALKVLAKQAQDHLATSCNR